MPLSHYLNNLAVNSDGEGVEFFILDFNCLKKQCPVTLQEIYIFARVN